MLNNSIKLLKKQYPSLTPHFNEVLEQLTLAEVEKRPFIWVLDDLNAQELRWLRELNLKVEYLENHVCKYYIELTF